MRLCVPACDRQTDGWTHDDSIYYTSRMVKSTKGNEIKTIN